jgi:hypothetical protein
MTILPQVKNRGKTFIMIMTILLQVKNCGKIVIIIMDILPEVKNCGRISMFGCYCLFSTTSTTVAKICSIEASSKPPTAMTGKKKK